jgi:hypothetical protein
MLRTYDDSLVESSLSGDNWRDAATVTIIFGKMFLTITIFFKFSLWRLLLCEINLAYLLNKRSGVALSRHLSPTCHHRGMTLRDLELSQNKFHNVLLRCEINPGIWSAEVFASARASAPTPAPPEEGTDALQNKFDSLLQFKPKEQQ